MKVLALIASCAFSVAAVGDLSSQSRLSMAEALAQDSDAATFLCGSSCSAQDIESLVEYKCEQSGPEVGICLLEPKRKARNMYIGVFARARDSEYRTQFIFFGSGIGLTGSTHLGVRDLNGREIEEGGAVSSYRYCWDGEHYVVGPANFNFRPPRSRSAEATLTATVPNGPSPWRRWPVAR